MCVLFSVDGRDSKITEGDHWSSDLVLERRANFTWPAVDQQEQQLKDNNGTTERASGDSGLVLRSLQLNDAGLYRCRVDYREAQTRNLLVNLTIIGKSSILSLYLFILSDLKKKYIFNKT